MARRLKASEASSRASATHFPENPIPTGPIRADIDVMMPDYPQRQDGWNAKRLQRFFDALCHTGCITDACRVSEMSTAAARRARKIYPVFAESWDRALEHSRPELVALAHHRATVGREVTIIRDGKVVQTKIEPSDSLLRLLLARGELTSGSKPGFDPDQVITFAEWQDDWRFDDDGKKHQVESQAIRNQKFVDKLRFMRRRMKEEAERGQTCPACNQPVTNHFSKQSFAELCVAGLISFDRIFD